MSEVEWNPASGTTDPLNGSPLADLGKAQKFTGMPWEANGDQAAPSTDPPQDNPGLQAQGSSSNYRRSIPVPDSPTLCSAFAPPLSFRSASSSCSIL